MIIDYFERIFKVWVYDVAIEILLDLVVNLLKWLGNWVYFKWEDLQLVFFFKLWGVYNKMVQLLLELLVKGVIVVLVGNYVQGVVLGVFKLGIRVIIVMFEIIFQVKVEVVKVWGGVVVFYGEIYDDVYGYV